MKKIRYIFVLILLQTIFVEISAAQEMKYSKVKIHVNSDQMKQLAGLGLPLDFGVSHRNNELIGEFSESDITKLQKNGFQYEILTADVSKFYSERNKTPFRLVKNSKTPVNFHLGSMGGNLTLAEIMTELDNMKTLYPDLITGKRAIDTSQLTYGGDSIYYVKITGNVSLNNNKPQVLYTGLTHAREPVGMMQLIYYMWYMLENYDTNPEVKYLVDSTEMYFIPCVNPEGYEYNRSTDPNGGGMWRKNRRNNGDGTYGVDINRNFGYEWGYDDNGSSPVTSDETYRGPSAFSEPEISMIKNFTENHHFLAANNQHTYSNDLLYPFGYANIYSPDENIFVNYAARMSRFNGFATGTPWEILYSVNGDSNDWMYGEQTTKNKIYAFTAETGTTDQGFWPASSDILPLCETNLEMNLMLTRFVSVYAEIVDKNQSLIKTSGYIKFNLQRLGLSGTGDYTVSLTSPDDIFETVGSDLSIQLPNVLDLKYDSIQYALKSSVATGSTIHLVLTANYGTYSVSDTLTKTVGETQTLLYDDCNAMTNWTSTLWNVTSSSYVSPGYSITDSPTGNYANNTTNQITQKQAVDLTGATFAVLSFQARWDIENDWDCVRLLSSVNGSTTWNPVQGKYTNPGVGGSSVQPLGQPVYDGTQQDWVQEEINLQNFLGSTVKFRFELKSDGYQTYDGFYFDDFTIVTLAPAASVQNSETGNLKIYPNPNQGHFNITFDTNLKFQKLEITDISGKSIFIQNIQNNDNIKDIQLKKGIYFVSLINDSGQKNTQKLVIY
jgi:hypothetical protein